MSDQPTNLEVLQAVVSDLTPINFTSACEVRGGEIVVTLCLNSETRTVTLPAEFQEADSDALTDALRMPIHKAYLELAAIYAKKPKRKKAKKAKKAKKRKAKRSKKSAPAASVGATSSAADLEATASPAPTPTTEGDDHGR